MGGFSQSTPPKACQRCVNACIDQKAKDEILIYGARERAKVVKQRKQTGSICDNMAGQVGEASGRLERYGAALPGARAARDLNELGNKNSGPVNQPCLTRLPLDAAGANKALGIDPKSKNALIDRDLRDDTTGYRSALYRDETNGQIILVSRDTQPDSLVDWKTNIDNGQGRDTAQYRSVRGLSSKLAANGTSFDIAGYSKGGGLAQEAGLVSPKSQVYVFNSSGLHPNSLARTGNANFNSLTSRTHAFSAEQDFLTYMNNTNDPAAQLKNAQFLRSHLAGDPWVAPMKLTHLNPADATGPPSAAFAGAKKALMADLDQMIANRSVAFPPVRAASKETIPGSMSSQGWAAGATRSGPTLGKLAQHQISNVVGTEGKPGPMEKQIAADRATLQKFRAQCG
jgi:hypothetical protein